MRDDCARTIRRTVEYGGWAQDACGVFHSSIGSYPHAPMPICADAPSSLRPCRGLLSHGKNGATLPRKAFVSRCNRSHKSGACFVTLVEPRQRDLRSCFGNCIGNLKKAFRLNAIEVRTEAYRKSRHAHRFGDFGYISLGREGWTGEFRYTQHPRAIGATVSAGALHAQGWGFESLIAHHRKWKRGPRRPRFFVYDGADEPSSRERLP